jgi:DNA-binding MarR family transcriptional regulator
MESQKKIDEKMLLLFRNCGHFIHNTKPISGGQRRVLTILLEQGNMTQRKLLDITGIRSASLSEVLMKIEMKNYIVRKKRLDDKRNIDISLTDEGKTIAGQIKEQNDENVKKLFSCLTDEEKTQLMPILVKLRDFWLSLDDHDFIS